MFSISQTSNNDLNIYKPIERLLNSRSCSLHHFFPIKYLFPIKLNYRIAYIYIFHAECEINMRGGHSNNTAIITSMREKTCPFVRLCAVYEIQNSNHIHFPFPYSPHMHLVSVELISISSKVCV